MVDAKIRKEIHFFCTECDNELDTCIICSESFADATDIKCTSEGHVHIECYE